MHFLPRLPFYLVSLAVLFSPLTSCSSPQPTPELGRLELSVTPQDASVTVLRSSGAVPLEATTAQAEGDTKLYSFELEAGSYRVTAQKAGRTAEEVIEVQAGAATASVLTVEPEVEKESESSEPSAAFEVSSLSGAAPFTVRVKASEEKGRSYVWDFGDGASATGTVAEYTYPISGTFELRLSVTDAAGAVVTEVATVTVTNPAPVATFQVDRTEGDVPLTVRFDASASSDVNGAVVSYAWDFGDGAVGEGVKVSHTYTSAGAFKTVLTVTDDEGATAQISQFIYVAVVPPSASFVCTPEMKNGFVGTAPLNVTCDASASRAGTGKLESYTWNFGDSATYTGRQVSHTFTSAGSFDITLTVTDTNGVPAQQVQTLVVNAPPQAALTLSATTGQAPLRVRFSAEGSRDAEGGLSYTWDFGDGSAGQGVNAEHTYTEVGTFTATLTVTDEQGAKVSATTDVTVQNAPPVASFTLSKMTGSTPLQVDLNATSSSDPNDQIASYRWDFGTGDTATGSRANYTYTRPGTFTVSLTVTDSYGAEVTTTKQVTVQNRPPTVTASASYLTVVEGSSLTFSASGSDPDGSVEEYAWDFGDGEGARGSTATHTFNKPGTFDVTVTATDDQGTESSDTLSVTVTPSYRLPALSTDGHTLLSGDEPFFWLGDTAWLLWRTTKHDDVTRYLDDAVTKGFTVVQVFLTAAWGDTGPNGANVFGDDPFLDNDPTRLNPAYFDYAAWVIDEAAKRGLYTAVMFGEPGRTGDGRILYRINDAAEGYTYGHALGEYFRAQTLENKIIWSSGQDRSGNKDLGPDGWRAMVEGVADGVNGENKFDQKADYSTTFMTHHPDGCCSSSQWFHADDWVDFNGINTWKNYWLIVRKIAGDLNRTPVKPTVCLEHSYENQRFDGEPRTDWHVRFQGYWCYLSGASGYAYGHQNGYKLVGSSYWPDYLNNEGRRDMLHLKTVLTSKPLGNRIPDQSLLLSDTGRADRNGEATYIVSARAADSSYALVYTTQGTSFELDLPRLAGDQVKAQWFDPRTGTYADAGTFATSTAHTFDPPGEVGVGNDWVLVVDSL